MKIDSQFESGNISCISCDNPNDIRLTINTDNNSPHFQWFFFSLTGAKQTACRMVIENAGDCAYQSAYLGYQTCASYDQQSWFRVPTNYDGKRLVIEHTPNQDTIYYAYFAPYTTDLYQRALMQAKSSALVAHQVLTDTPDGHQIDLLTVQSAAINTQPVWIIARQHPGETMASWWIEGFIEALLDRDNKLATQLLTHYHFYIVPNMNPDGSARGNLRTNANGYDLNRAWLEASPEQTPEVYYVREKMKETGVKLFLDIHGDEELPYNFIHGAMGIPTWSDARQAQLDAYKADLAAISPDFQTKFGYPTPAPGRANIRVATNFVAETFGVLAMTIEMPFKDANNNPDPIRGWSPARCKTLAHEHMQAMLSCKDKL